MQVVNWLLSHQGVVASVVIALYDLARALNPKVDDNGFLHRIYLAAVAKKPPQQ